MKHKFKLVSLSLALITALSGCEKKADCDVDGNHVHLYISEVGFKRYLNKEYLSYENYERQDDYILVEKDELALKAIEDKYDVFLIKDNLEFIKNLQIPNEDFWEYRYEYVVYKPTPREIYAGMGKITYYIDEAVRQHSWTTNPNHRRLTGQTRVCHCMYQAYKIEYDEDGNPVLIPSPLVDDLTTVMDEFPYIKEKFIIIFDKTHGIEADYENVPEEEENEVLKNNTDSSLDGPNINVHDALLELKRKNML